MKPKLPIILHLSYRVQAIGARLLFAIFAALPLDRASAFGGWLGRKLGPLTPRHRVAISNLRRALPYKNSGEMRDIIVAMWDNIGRTLAEYPHLGELMKDESRIEIVDNENYLARIRDDGIGALMVGMHAGNWELYTVPGFRAGLKQHHFYRAPKNPFVARMLAKMRAEMRQEGYLPRGGEGAVQAAALLENHAHIGMLVDRRQDTGTAALLFGRDAITTTAPAALAQRFDLPIVADRVVRLKGAKFRIYVEPVPVIKTGDQAADVLETTKKINLLLENWIRQNPAQWFWLHRRWPSEG